MILALETAFEHCSVCLFKQDGSVALLHEHAPRLQTQRILPMIDTILAQQQMSFPAIRCIAFNRGPGSFSGIRINTAVAQALAFAHDIPCVPVSSLQAQAQAFFHAHPSEQMVTVINDAKMGEVYLSNFEKTQQGFAKHIGSEQMISYEADVSTEILTQNITGDGVEKLQLKTEHKPFSDITMTAEHIAILAHEEMQKGNLVTAKDAQPVYLRNHAWKTLAEQKASKKTI